MTRTFIYHQNLLSNAEKKKLEELIHIEDVAKKAYDHKTLALTITDTKEIRCHPYHNYSFTLQDNMDGKSFLFLPTYRFVRSIIGRAKVETEYTLFKHLIIKNNSIVSNWNSYTEAELGDPWGEPSEAAIYLYEPAAYVIGKTVRLLADTADESEITDFKNFLIGCLDDDYSPIRLMIEKYHDSANRRHEKLAENKIWDEEDAKVGELKGKKF